MFKQADETWEANGGTPTPIIAAVAAPTTTQDPQVAAIAARGGGRGRGRGGRGGRGGGRGGGSSSAPPSSDSTSYNTNASSNKNKPHQRGPQHADLPSDASWACAQHWKKGRAAPYCSDPHVCKWVNKTTPRTTTSTTT